MKILVVFWGESYRSGPQMSSLRGTDDYMKRQMLASISHMKLIKTLEEQGHSIDVILDTYKLNDQDDNSLLTYYQRNMNVIENYFYNGRFPSETDFTANMHNIILNNINKSIYDNILYIRIDLYLKNYFLKTVNFDDEKIQFVHMDSNINVKNSNISNRFMICQQIISIPKKYYFVIPLILYIYPHHYRDHLLDSGISKDDIIFMTNTLHVCSTDLGWNPFYIQVGRNYNKEYNTNCGCCSSVEYYYDTETHQFIYDISKTVDKWKPYLNDDSLEENLAAISENSFEELF